MSRKYVCPCCGCLTVDKLKAWSICPVCFWEDEGGVYDGDTVRDDVYSVPNHMTLAQARDNYRRFGACRKELSSKTREPTEQEIVGSYMRIAEKIKDN